MLMYPNGKYRMVRDEGSPNSPEEAKTYTALPRPSPGPRRGSMSGSRGAVVRHRSGNSTPDHQAIIEVKGL